MTPTQPAVRLLIAPLLLLGIARDGNSQDSRDPFSIRISPPQAAVEAGSGAKIQVEVTNTSGAVTSVGKNMNLDAVFSGFQVHAYDVQNRHLRMTPMAWSFSGRKASADDKSDYSGKDYKQQFLVSSNGEGGLPLDPGEKRTYCFNLFDAYNLGPGKYTIAVSIQDWKSRVVVTSNKIEITVVGKGELQPEQKAAPPR